MADLNLLDVTGYLPIELRMSLAEMWGEDWPDEYHTAINDAEAGDWSALLDLRARMYSLAVAATAARRRVDLAIAEALGDGGSVHDGQTWHRSSIDGALKVRDGESLLKWAAEDAGLMFNPNTARVGSVRMIAEGRGENPVAAVDSFFHRPGTESGIPELSSRPLDHEKTPKYAAKMRPFEPRTP